MDELRIVLKLDSDTILKIMKAEPVSVDVLISENVNMKIQIELGD
jgi:hypothetical protein